MVDEYCYLWTNTDHTTGNNLFFVPFPHLINILYLFDFDSFYCQKALVHQKTKEVSKMTQAHIFHLTPIPLTFFESYLVPFHLHSMQDTANKQMITTQLCPEFPKAFYLVSIVFYSSLSSNQLIRQPITPSGCLWHGFSIRRRLFLISPYKLV